MSLGGTHPALKTGNLYHHPPLAGINRDKENEQTAGGQFWGVIRTDNSSDINTRLRLAQGKRLLVFLSNP